MELVVGQIVLYPKAGRELEKFAQDELMIIKSRSNPVRNPLKPWPNCIRKIPGASKPVAAMRSIRMKNNGTRILKMQLFG